MSTEHAAEPVTESAAAARARNIVATYEGVQAEHGSAYCLGIMSSRLEALVAEYDRLEAERADLQAVNHELLRRLETNE